MKIGGGVRLGIVLVILSFALAAVLFPRLPDPVPTHWSTLDLSRPDGWTPKPWGALMNSLMMAFFFAAFLVVGRALRAHLDQFRRPWQTVFGAAMTFFFVITSAEQLFLVDRRVPVNRVMAGCAGLLFMVLGNLMGKLTRNPVFGIRTAWTLASDEVWVRTHQMGGKLMVVAGAVLALSAVAGWSPVPALVGLGLSLVATVLYSYRTYRKLQGSQPPQPVP